MIEANGVRTAAAAVRGPSMGQFVSLRGRLWLVEEQPETPFDGHRLACVDDDASGEDAQVLWSAEVDARLRDEEAWASLASGGGDAETFSAYLRTVRWRTATAAERDLFQAPFRAGIRLDPYQLLPLRKALRLPRVNLLIADDVGLGKTVEAGLVLREMLLRRRVDYMVVLAPAAMTGQWQDELQTKFGLSFEIIDRQHLESLRRRRGYGANPWATGSRFILSHRLLGDEAYVAGLRDVLEEFRARSLLILDEAHHAAPAGGGRYAVESQFTRSLRDLSDRFEHRLFLSATPHNGHPNSFATLLELLDPQRFTRGVPVRPADLEPVMVRRLKSDLRALGEAFPERVVEPVVIDGLDRHAPELRLAAMLADYRALRERRIGTLGAAQGARARLAFVGLQQRLLSSVPAFARTLRVHLAGLERLIAGETAQPAVADEDPDAPERADEEDAAFERLDRAEAVRTEAAAMAAGGAAAQLMAERDHAAAMLVVADAAKTAPDARVRWIIDWARANLLDAEGRWRDRRLILFTEYEDTRRWLQRQLSVLLDPADADEVARIESFTGVTSTERREAITRAHLVADAVLLSFFEGSGVRDREARLAEVQQLVLAPSAQSWSRLEALRERLHASPVGITSFHWELEFEDVFTRPNPGFDAIVGNPPFAGKNTIAAGHAAAYPDWLKTLHPHAHGNADLAAHFFRRAFGLLRRGGAFGLIATNTIRQGDTRDTGLRRILDEGGVIYRAVSRHQWEGDAAVVVAQVFVRRGAVAEDTGAVLDGRPVRRISAYLMEGDLDGSPAVLRANAGKAFAGTEIFGNGFTFDDADTKQQAYPLALMHDLRIKVTNFDAAVFPYLGGEEATNHPRHQARRFVIDFRDYPLQRTHKEIGWHDAGLGQRRQYASQGDVPLDYPDPVASDWPILLQMVRDRVKPIRDPDNREVYRRLWWRFAERRVDLYNAIAGLSHVLVVNRGASPHVAFARVPTGQVFAKTLAVFALPSHAAFATLQSRVHEVWTRFFASTLEERLRYTPTDCFETFPLPPDHDEVPALEAAGQAYHDTRAALMVAAGQGMTPTYNRFHRKADTGADIESLRALHHAMDRAVLAAYGWEDLAAEAAPVFLDADSEDDHRYQGRLFWPAPFRDAVLARLLTLNEERATMERML